MKATRQNTAHLALPAGQWPMRIRNKSKEAFTLAPYAAVKAVAGTVGMTAEAFSRRIVDILVESMDLMYEDDVRNVTIADFCNWWDGDLRFVALQIPGLDPDALGRLRLFGTGDCPNCGGEMEVVDGDYWAMRPDYDSETEYVPRWEAKRCACCGHESSNEPAYN